MTPILILLAVGAILGRSEQLDRRERRRWTGNLARREQA